MKCDSLGRIKKIPFIASPNYDERPGNTEINLLVIHNISLPPGQFGGNAIVELFTNKLDFSSHSYYQTLKDLKVSSHFLIKRNGDIIQFVLCSKRAWHAGLSTWKGRAQCNDFSIGIELEGTDRIPFEDTQYDVLIQLSYVLLKNYPINDVVGHSDISPGRKTDPGIYFDWTRYRNALKKRDPNFLKNISKKI